VILQGYTYQGDQKMEFKIGRIHLGKGIPTPASLFVEQKKCSQPNRHKNGLEYEL